MKKLIMLAAMLVCLSGSAQINTTDGTLLGQPTESSSTLVNSVVTMDDDERHHIPKVPEPSTIGFIVLILSAVAYTELRRFRCRVR